MSPGQSQQTRPQSLDLPQARQIAEEAIRTHAAAGPFLASAVLSETPVLWEHASVVIDLAYEEYCQRVERGEQVDVVEFAGRFQQVGQKLQHQLLVHQLLVDDLPQPAAPADWPAVPGPFSHFQLIQQLGEGAAARVYLALDLRLDERPRVLKVCSQIAVERSSLSRLAHSSIVDALFCDRDEASGLQFIAMPLQGRWTLQQVLRIVAAHRQELRTAGALWTLLDQLDDIPEAAHRGEFYRNHADDRRSIEELVISWARTLLTALQHLHESGMLHCDVKPSNILIAWSGDAILLDLHAAQMLNAHMHIPSGTIPYMAAEQLSLFVDSLAAKEVRLTAKTDLFGWGATFAEAISGVPAFAAPAANLPPLELARAHLIARQSGLQPTSERQIPLTESFLQAIGDCLNLAAVDRPGSAGAVIERLQSIDHWHRRSLRLIRTYPLRSLASAAGVFVASVALCFGISAQFPDSQHDTVTGLRELASGELAAAAWHFERAVAWASENEQARLGLVVTKLRQGQYDVAATHLERLPASPMVDRCRAYILAKNGQFEEAGKIYEVLINSQYFLPEDYCNGAFCKLKRREMADWQLAERWLISALESQPQLEEAWVSLILVQRRIALREGFPPDFALIARATAQVPESMDVWFQAAMTYAKEGHDAELQRDVPRGKEIRALTITAVERAAELGLGQESWRFLVETWPAVAQDSRLRRIAERLPKTSKTLNERRLVCPAPPNTPQPLVAMRLHF